VQYTYSFGDTVLGLSDANITLGIQNVTDEEPPVISVVTAYDGRLHDGRGRIWFARVGGSL
jgi:outer membrane receptor protein involved in Fe transport